MRELIDKHINWQGIGNHETGEYHYDITEAVISKETGVLTIKLRLNFIMPSLDMEKLRGIILHSIDHLSDVKFEYIYADMILDEKETVKLFIPHMIEIINGKYAAITKTIQTDKFTFDGEHLKIYALGKLSTEQLNEKVAHLFQQLLNDNFGINTQVTFLNDEEVYSKAAESWKASEESDIKASLQQPQELQQKYARASRTSRLLTAEEIARAADLAAVSRRAAGNEEKKEAPAEGNRIMGKDIMGQSVSLSSLSADSGVVIVEGILFKKDSRPIKNEKKLVTLLITDKKTSVCLKAFCSNNKWDEIDSLLKSGDYIKVRGETEWDRYDNCLVVMLKDINKSKIKKREDTFEGGKRVELHAHTKMSAMDGLNEVENLVKTAAYWGQPAVAITDHGVVQSFPDAAKTAKKLAGNKDNPIHINIIYGMEGYVFDDSDCHNADGTIDFKKKPTNHIILLARTQEGLKNIYKLVSYSHLNYFYKRPRLPKSLIEEHREGLIIGSACEAGEVYRAIAGGKSQEEIEEIASFTTIWRFSL